MAINTIDKLQFLSFISERSIWCVRCSDATCIEKHARNDVNICWCFTPV